MASRGRPREFDPEVALDAAMLLFWRHGYEGTSLAALSQATGVNMPSLYAAFGNKEALFRTALERYMKQQASYLTRAMSAPTAREAVERLFDGAIELAMNPAHPDGCMLVQGALATGPSSAAIKADLSAKRNLAESCIRRRFEQAQAAGEFPDGTDVAALAGYVMTLIWGLSVQAAGGATREQLRSVADRVLADFPKTRRRR